MINIFRKIRQRLLKENRVPRYMLYAVGEIILVVIGILLAVKINDWNEEKKLINSNRIHLQKMILEMDENMERMNLLAFGLSGLNYGFPALDEAISNSDSLLNLSYKGLRPDHIQFIVEGRFFAGRSSLNLQQDVFEELKSIGRLNYIGSDSLVSSIKKYNKKYLREKYYNAMHNENIIRCIEKLENGFGKIIMDYNRNRAQFSIEDYPWFFDKKSREYQDIQIAFTSALDSQKKNLEKIEEFYKLSESLKQIINHELNSSNP